MNSNHLAAVIAGSPITLALAEQVVVFAHTAVRAYTHLKELGQAFAALFETRTALASARKQIMGLLVMGCTPEMQAAHACFVPPVVLGVDEYVVERRAKLKTQRFLSRQYLAIVKHAFPVDDSGEFRMTPARCACMLPARIAHRACRSPVSPSSPRRRWRVGVRRGGRRRGRARCLRRGGGRGRRGAADRWRCAAGLSRPESR